MWSNKDYLFNQKTLNQLTHLFSTELIEFVKQEQLDHHFISDFHAIFLPLAIWIKNKHIGEPLIIGLNGAQGSGKTTLCKLLVLILKKLFNKSVLHLSIDDLYYSRHERLLLATSIHPLLKVRGVPGTHDVELGLNILTQIKNRTVSNLKLPIFDKSIDDLLPSEQWKTISNTFDIVLFEGWCIGAKPQHADALKLPINHLEATKDLDCHWRQYVNDQLATEYKALFSKIDHLIMLKIPNIDAVFEWRNLQEIKLKNTCKHSKLVMSESDIKQFIMYFERITRQCLEDMPERASVVLNLNEKHQITDIKLGDIT